MKNLLTMLLMLCLVAPLAIHAAMPQQETGKKVDSISLFNGRNLDGWKGDMRYWKVENGAIVGQCGSPDLPCITTYLHHETPYSDFQLDFMIKLEGEGANSGMQYRSTPMGKEHGDGWDLSGYQADFDAKHTYSGILYETKGRAIAAQRGESIRFNADGGKTEIAPREDDQQLKTYIANSGIDGWHRYRIIANGPRLEHWIDGKRVVLVEDNAKQRASKGIFALQIHGGPPMTVRAKNLRLKPLGTNKTK